MYEDWFDEETCEIVIELAYSIAHTKILKMQIDGTLGELDLKSLLEEAHEDAMERVLKPLYEQGLVIDNDREDEDEG